MAYCRFSEQRSEAYVIGSASFLECLGCRIDPRRWWTTNSRSAMVRHLQDHRQRGHKVPFHATRRLKREIRQLGDDY